MSTKVILASASPRRAELLRTIGIEFCSGGGSDVDETAILAGAEGSLRERLRLLARLKGESVSQAEPEAIVLSADTVVVLGEHVMGKPVDAADARRMLKELSGETHQVYTSVAVQCAANSFSITDCEVTCVSFYPLNDVQIAHYVELAQPFDKAGSYAIQELGALLVSEIKGDYSNVVGLPLGLTARLLSEAGVTHPLG